VIAEKECTAPDELFSQTWGQIPVAILAQVPENGLPCQQPGRPWTVGKWCSEERCPFAVNRWPWDGDNERD